MREGENQKGAMRSLKVAINGRAMSRELSQHSGQLSHGRASGVLTNEKWRSVLRRAMDGIRACRLGFPHRPPHGGLAG